MEYTKLGNTDIEISKICVGCMSFGKAGTMHDWTLDESSTNAVVKHALDLGINFRGDLFRYRKRIFCGHKRGISRQVAQKRRQP